MRSTGGEQLGGCKILRIISRTFLSPSKACVNGFLRSTRLTLDFAAPVKQASAPLHHGHLLRPIAPSAAHQIASVDAQRRVIALSSVRAENAESRVLLAKAR